MPTAAPFSLFLALAACQPSPVQLGPVEPEGLAILGSGGHTVADVTLDGFGSSALDGPRDLAFHPDEPELLWVANRNDDSIVIFDVSEDEPEADVRKGEGSEHFLANPGALAFGDDGYLATAQDEDEQTQPGTPVDFMGPTLWIADPSEFNGDWASHYDMLHNSPDGVGIAWERDNIYWVFDGYHEAVTRYDFNDDHDGGGEDHSDGEVARYAEGEVSFGSDTASHLVYDPEPDLLYIADGGNGRVAVLDTMSGEEGENIAPNYDGTDQYEVEGAEVWTLAGSESVADLERPSGIVFAFTAEGEIRCTWRPVGPGRGGESRLASCRTPRSR